MRQTFTQILVGHAIAVLFGLGSLVEHGQATTFFDDLTADYGGTEIVSEDRWLAGTFTTDSATYSTLTATLLLAETSAGSAQLALYTDGDYEPGDYVASSRHHRNTTRLLPKRRSRFPASR